MSLRSLLKTEGQIGRWGEVLKIYAELQIELADRRESCVAHPFFTLVVTLRSVAYSLDLADDDPALARLRDIYLDPWRRYASWDDLQSTYVLASRVQMVNRALTWYRVVSHLEESYRCEEADAVPGWLKEFLEVVTRDMTGGR